MSLRLFALTSQILEHSGHRLAVKEIHRIMSKLLDNHSKYFSSDLDVNSRHVSDVFCQLVAAAVSDSKDRKVKLDYETRQQIERVIKRLEDMWKNPKVPVVGTAEAYTAMILYLCNQQKPKEAYQMLQWMIQVADSGEHPVPMIPRVSSFVIVMSTFGKMGEPTEASEVLNWMLRFEGSAMPAPNTTCFNGLLDAWAKSGRNDAGTRAEQALEWMEQLHDSQGLDTRPNDISYNICTNAWARTPGPDSPARAEAVLRRLIDLHESGSNVAPSEPAFTSVMNAWANSKREDAPDKVNSLLKLMESMAATTDGLSTSAVPYSILIKAWGQLASQSRGTKKTHCVDRVLEVLTHMEDMKVTPTAPVHNAILVALLDAWPPNGVFYFLELEEQYRNGLVQMDTRTFNCGLNAIAALNKPDQAEQAMTILQRMFQYSENDKAVCPDETTFNIILKVLSRSRSKDTALKASQLLQEMDRLPNVKPSYISYLTCIIAWGRSNAPDKFERVEKLLADFKESHKQNKLSGRLAVPPYNAALSVCHHNTLPEHNAKALQTALNTMVELRKIQSVQPDHTTYQSFFQCIGLFAELDQRDSLLLQELAQCTKDGLVSREILEMVFNISPNAFRQFFGENESLATVTIPKEWTKNADGPRRQPNHSSGVLF